MKKLVVIFVMTSLFISIFAGCNVELQNGVETQSTDVTEYEAEYAIESIVGTEEEESQKGDEATEVESEIEAETEIDCEQNTENEAEIAVDETQKLEQDQNSQNADTSGSDINSNTNNNNNSNNNSSNGNCNNDNGNNNYNASESSDEVRKKAKAVIAEITNASMSDLEKALAIYNWMAKNIEYDMEGYLSGSISLECFSAYGALFDGLAVCDGYARTFIVLAEEAGLGVKYVSGLANNGETFGSHAWNQVEIDGVWYNVDITWDDVGNEIFFDYFLLSNDDMLKDHFPDIIGVDYANCPETYRRNVIIKTANKTGLLGTGVAYAETPEEFANAVNAFGDVDIEELTIWYYSANEDVMGEVFDGIELARYPLDGGISFGGDFEVFSRCRLKILTHKDISILPIVTSGEGLVEFSNQQFDIGLTEFYVLFEFPVGEEGVFSYNPNNLRYECDWELLYSFNGQRNAIYRAYLIDEEN